MADRRDKIHSRMDRVGRKAGARKPARQPANTSANTKKSSGNDGRSTVGSRRKPQTTAPKQRVRPSAKVTARKQAIKSSPMPKPPKRRPVVRTAAVAGAAAATAAVVKAATPEDEAAAKRIQDQFAALEEKAQLTTIYNAIGNMDKLSTELPFAIEKLRDRGYVHSGMLEDRLEAIDDKWDDVRPRVESQLAAQVKRLDEELDDVEPKVNRMKASDKNSVRTAETAVTSLQTRVDSAVSSVAGLYDGIEDELNKIQYEIQQVDTMLTLLDESPEIRLQEAEGPLLAVKTKWHRDGEKDGPEGVLFLTDQRLIFEQREEIKKKVGLFKSEKEKLQEVLITVQVHEIDNIEHKEEGGFLGMGKDDIIEMTFDATAQLSRARFHLQGQDSSAWAAMIKRVQTGEIDQDRCDEYVDELAAAAAITASFPTQCPNCFAAVPKPDRGVTSLTCEFCGAVIAPES